MGQATNTCIIYDKIKQSGNVLGDVSYSRANFNTKITLLTDKLVNLSSNHDNSLEASLSILDEVNQNINGGFDVIEKMSYDLYNVISTYNEAEGKFDDNKLSKAIQKSKFVSDDIKGNIEDNGIATYSSRESFEKNLTDEEIKILEEYKKNMEELTSSKVFSNIKTVNDFLTFGTTSSFITALTTTSLLTPSKTPLEFLDDVTGPYSKEGLKDLLMDEYPGLTEEMANKYVAQHFGEEIPEVEEKAIKKATVSEDEPDDPNISYRKNTSDSDDYSSYDDSYSSYNDDYSSGNSSSSDDLYDDNSGNESSDNSNIIDDPSDNKDGTDLGSDEDVKNGSEDQIKDDIIEEKPEADDTSGEIEVPEDSEMSGGESDSSPSDETPTKNNTPQSSILSQIGNDLTTSITGGTEEIKDPLDLQTDETSKISTLLSGNKNSAIDEMLTYSSTVSEDKVNTNSSFIAPAAIGLGLAGTTSVAANKIIKKKEKKQEDIINNFFDKGKEERKFIPLDVVGDDLDNSFEGENVSKKDDDISSTEKEKTPEEWYDYIKELY